MARIIRSLQVPYSAELMFNLVDKIEDYPLYLPCCESTEVKRSDEQVEASMTASKGPLRYTFTTTNLHDKEKLTIAIKLASGPFSSMVGNWAFIKVTEDSCRVEFELEYEFATRLLDKMLSPLFMIAYCKMLDSFVDQARRLHHSG